MDSFFEKDYENLNDAILKAIVSSKEVQKILVILKKKEEIDNMAVLNLFLSLDELYEMISEKKNNSVSYKLELWNQNSLQIKIQKLTGKNCHPSKMGILSTEKH